MATFLTSNDLNAELENIFEFANEYLILISPFIKLHERYLSTLKTNINNHDLKIIIVFGKNEENISKSMKQEDFNFFKEFPNIEIRYEKRLHAKYYANEKSAILTSMNLLNYSQDNNIEAGVLTNRKGFLSNSENDLEYQAFNYFGRVIEQSDLLFKKVPKLESSMLGLTKKYISSEVETDILSDFFNSKIKKDFSYKEDRAIQVQNKNETGFCIRTGVKIPFNPKHPMCDNAYLSWKKYNKTDYPEKFCHFSGEPSNGQTNFAKPIMTKYWRRAQEIHGF